MGRKRKLKNDLESSNEEEAAILIETGQSKLVNHTAADSSSEEEGGLLIATFKVGYFLSKFNG